MKTHPWKAFYQIPVELLIMLDAEIFDARGHTIPEYPGERARARSILDHDIPGIHRDIFDHGLTELSGAGPDRSYTAGPCYEAPQEMECILKLFERSGGRMKIHAVGGIRRMVRVR
jgi:hypothetical protein